MWIDWFLPASPWSILWVVLGTLGMYLTLLGLARWSGVRSFAEMSAFDVAVTIAVGSMLATTVAAQSPPLLLGATALATLFAIQLTASRLRIGIGGFTRVTDNTPILLVGPGGTLKRRGMRMARVTESDLRSHLRAQNVMELSEVQAVVIEGTGKIHVLHGHGDRDFEGRWIAADVRDHDGPDPVED